MGKHISAIKIALSFAAALVLSACGTLRHLNNLNDPSRSIPALDVANLSSPRNIPYETVEKGGISVSYNLFFAKSNNLSGYRLTLVLRNNTGSLQVLKPAVSLQNAGGFVIASYTYESFVTEAASLAGTAVPLVPVSTHSTFGDAFAQGMARGDAMRAANDREEGRLMLRWANSFWLKNTYELPPNTAVSGVLFFPAATVGQLPLRLVVEVGGQKFEFMTASK